MSLVRTIAVRGSAEPTGLPEAREEPIPAARTGETTGATAKRRPGRVLHLFKIYRPLFTGEGVFTERSSRAMAALAPEVEHDILVTSMPRPAEPVRVCSTLAEIHHLSARPLNQWQRELALFWWFLRRIHRYDTIHARVHVDWYFAIYLLARLTGRRLVLSATLDDSVPMWISQYRTGLRPLVRRLFRLFDAYISISPKLHAETASEVDPQRCHLLPCGIEIPPVDRDAARAVRDRLGIPEDALVLIFVGGLCARKDPMLLVRNLPTVLAERPDTYLLLVGPELEPDLVEEMRAFVQAEGLTERVKFIGEVMDPHPYFDAADIMTFGSKLEGFGTVVPEAMAHRLPVVVRRLPGVNDLFVRDGETGFFFDDEEGYRAAVTRLAGDAALRRRLGDAAHALVSERFDMEVVARRYLEIYGFPDTLDLPGSVGSTATAREAMTRVGTTASIFNRRMQAPVVLPADRQPLLLTVIDAEEAFDWGQPFSRAAVDVSSMRHQVVAHRIFDRHGVVPLYAVDYPVATHPDGVQPLRELLADGRCEVGAQLHPWVNPPFVEEICERNSFPGSLPMPLEFEKARLLTEAIRDSFGVQPQVYRAGRYGAGPRTADIMKALGYRADSSVMPAWDFSGRGGPDYLGFPSTPFWLDAERSVVEIPGTAGIVGLFSRAPLPLRRLAFSETAQYAGLTGLLARTGLMERIRLTPEGMALEDAQRLVRHLLRDGQRIFTLSYHSPSLVPGNTPYVRTAADLARMLDWLDRFYDFFVGEIGGRCVTWTGTIETLMAGRNRSA